MYLAYCDFLREKYHAKMSKEEVKKTRYEIANQLLRDVVDYKPDAEKVLKFLKEKGFILVIASTTNDHTIDIYRNENERIKEKANFDDFFQAIYARGSVEKRKPDPEVYEKIKKEFGVKSEECLIFEDSLIGVEAANRAGIDVAIVYDPYSDEHREEINQRSNYQFQNFQQILEKLKEEFK